MIGKRGRSFGPEHPIHYERRRDGWAVFDARDDRDIVTGLKEWEARDRCVRENGITSVDTAALDCEEDP